MYFADGDMVRYHMFFYAPSTPSLVQVCPSGKNALQYCELSRVRTWLELEEGGGEALMVLAFLVGGDYHTGAERVGLRSAFAAVSHLLKGHKVCPSVPSAWW